MESVISPYDDITPYISVLAVTRRMCIAYIQPFFFWWYEILAERKVDYSIIQAVYFALWVPPLFLPERKHSSFRVQQPLYSWKEKQIFAWHMFYFVILNCFRNFIKFTVQWKTKYSKSNTSVVKRWFYAPYSPGPMPVRTIPDFTLFWTVPTRRGGDRYKLPGPGGPEGGPGPDYVA